MKRNLDQKIWLYTILIVVAGLVALYSAAHDNVRVPRSIFYDQFIFSLVGLGIMYLVGKVDYRKFYDAAYIFYGLNVLLLLLVLVGGKDALGARRWIDLGPFSFQPSEVTKLSVILVLGRYFSDIRPRLSFDLFSKAQALFINLLVPFFLSAVLMLLIFKQPDLGTALLIFGMFVVMLFASGIEYKYFIGFLVCILSVIPFAWHVLKPYQKDRLLVFLNPNIDPLGAGYTIIQSKIAIGSGQLFGKGWLSGTQNQLNFLPERHTDFIFSVIGEEWGFIGAVMLIYFYFRLIENSFMVAEQVKDTFGTLVSIGIIAILVLQVVINIGMVMGVFPVVGLTLPFVSYGRSSFLVFLIMMGFLLNLSNRRTIF